MRVSFLDGSWAWEEKILTIRQLPSRKKTATTRFNFIPYTSEIKSILKGLQGK
jgi:hypothetical protein